MHFLKLVGYFLHLYCWHKHNLMSSDNCNSLLSDFTSEIVFILKVNYPGRDDLKWRLHFYLFL